MATFEEVFQGGVERKLVRKIQKGLALIAPQSVDLPESLYATGSLIDFKAAGWLPLGLVDPSGFVFEREVESEDISALGFASPIRDDVTSVARSVAATLLQSGQKHIEELLKGTDLSAVTQDPATGEIVYDEPDLPINKEYRLLVLGTDGPADEQWIMGKGYGAVKLSASGSETWGAEGAKSNEITLKVFTDDELGTPVRHYMGGTGAVKFKDVLGYGPVTP